MTATTESPESRLYTAGFTRQLEFWLSPDGHRVLSLGDAIAALDSGAISPAAGVEFPDTGVRAFPQAEVIAAVTVAKLKPLIRAEVRAALKAEARKQAREPQA